MIEPVTSDAALVAHIRATAGLMDEHVRLWWLGQSGFLVQWRGRHLLLDPYLSDSLTKKYANTEKPHVRMTRRVVDPAQLDFIDVVTSSHAHTDHLDAETLKPLRRASPLSMAATLALVRAARGDRSIRQSLAREMRFTARTTAEGDFLEGVRAQIIDKDRSPKWAADASPAHVAHMLSSLGPNEITWEDA